MKNKEYQTYIRCIQKFHKFHKKERISCIFMTIPFPNQSDMILCCPEDGRYKHQSCTENTQCCAECKALLCRECKSGLTNFIELACMPAASLCDDMMIAYAPQELYINKVKNLDMICTI